MPLVATATTAAVLSRSGSPTAAKFRSTKSTGRRGAMANRHTAMLATVSADQATTSAVPDSSNGNT